MSILEIITEHDKANPISRRELTDLFGMTDRNVRKNIEELRKKGHRICATSCDKGYYLAQTDEQFRRFLADYTSKAWSIIRTARAMEKGVENVSV